MSPIAGNKRYTEAEELDRVIKMLDGIFKYRIIVKALAKQYNLYIEDKAITYADLNAQKINAEEARSGIDRIVTRRDGNLKNILVRASKPHLGDIESMFRSNSSYIIQGIRYRLKNEGLLLLKKSYSFEFPSIYLHKFTEMMDRFEDFCKRHQYEPTEIKVKILTGIRFEFED